jgi:hypothetical protein
MVVTRSMNRSSASWLPGRPFPVGQAEWGNRVHNFRGILQWHAARHQHDQAGSRLEEFADDISAGGGEMFAVVQDEEYPASCERRRQGW